MSNAVFAIAEMALVFLPVIGYCVWELHKLKQYKKTDDKVRVPGEDPYRGLFGTKVENTVASKHTREKEKSWTR